MTWLIGATAVACAMMGSIFFAFSSFVMPALGNVPAEEGVHAMQRINIDVFHWSFMGAFVVTPLACVAVAANSLLHWEEPGAVYGVIGCAVYLIGTFAVTTFGNVPLNNTLAMVDTSIVDASHAWSAFATAWTRWNHVRTFASLAAAGWFLLALVVENVVDNFRLRSQSGVVAWETVRHGLGLTVGAASRALRSPRRIGNATRSKTRTPSASHPPAATSMRPLSSVGVAWSSSLQSLPKAAA